ncbi:probable jasmonic acid carboxyl methyltransferase 1 [Musa acuminata AAA Group]|uniref:probable jasmonic acid carboxyl methyltransferase 1 n=1 Tax=Musa acuminata AAA Group TaxID=214697 RepID=UPI0031D37DB2
MELQRVMRMNSGAGESSYANNSKIQGVIISRTKDIRREAVVEAYLCAAASSGTMSIADLGCSSGPNALLVVADIVEAIERSCLQLQSPPPDFHVLLNDLYWNDFNTVFRSLPEFYRARERFPDCGRCFFSAVPGSFYGRLFPGKSLHFVHSSSSLHWLSQVPEELQNGSPVSCLNKGKVYISKTSPWAVLNAYLKQFRRDLRLFLRCRSEEIVGGGRMVLALMDRRSPDLGMPEDCHLWELLAEALNDMASEGLVATEKIDTFNAPFYAPSLEELKQVVEEEGSFSITTIEHFEAGWDAVADHHSGGQGQHDTIDRENGAVHERRKSYARRMAMGVRAVLESMLKGHFGEGILDELFFRYGKLLESYYSANKPELGNVVVAMVRN